MKLLCHVTVVLAISTAIYGQTVTATAKVRIDGRVETVRKINGRWWSQDNRQLTPAKDGFIWWISSERGKSFAFHHHHPVNLALAESLHLFMSPSEAQGLLGPPNETADHDRSHLWNYYAENGTALFLQFGNDELFQARYERQDFGLAGRPVQSVARDLAGRDIFKLMADRAWQRSNPAAYAKFHEQTAPAQVGSARTITISDPSGSSAPPPPKRRIASDVADSVKIGMTRADVVQIMGDPSAGMHISSGDSDSETMSYPLDTGRSISFEMDQGKVVRISK